MLKNLWVLKTKKKNKYKKKFEVFNLYKKILLFFFLKGKKYIIESKFKQSLCSIILRFRRTLIFKKIIVFFFLKLQTFVEFRAIKKRLREYFIPFLINYSRQLFLAVFFFKKVLKSDKSSTSFGIKLKKEMNKIIKEQTSDVVNFIIKNNVLAYKNRSNAKFRW